jgi:hypothetical protein
LNRDPIEERGGVNLYAFAERDPINKIDHLGLIKVTPKITRKTKNDDCGKFKMEWLIELEKKHKTTGYVVSHITFDWDVKDCDEVKVPPPSKYSRDYFEAYRFFGKPNGGEHIKYTDVWNADKKNDCTNGSLTVTADLRYYLESRTGNIQMLEGAWTGDGDENHPISGILPSTYEEPLYFGNSASGGEPTQRMSIKISWECCNDNAFFYETTLHPPVH